ATRLLLERSCGMRCIAACVALQREGIPRNACNATAPSLGRAGGQGRTKGIPYRAGEWRKRPMNFGELLAKIRDYYLGHYREPLADWFMAWFDQDDERGLYYSDLQGVVHCLTDPVFADGAATFTIDFGSAPADVFEYLLDALEQLGAKTVQIGNVDKPGDKNG